MNVPWRKIDFPVMAILVVSLSAAVWLCVVFYRGFGETEAELKARLSEADLAAIVAWGRGTALQTGSEELPEDLRRLGVRWAAVSEFRGEKGVFFYLVSDNGKSGLLVKQPDAGWPDPPHDWSQWSPGVYYHRE